MGLTISEVFPTFVMLILSPGTLALSVQGVRPLDVSKATWLSLAPQCYGNHSLTSPKSSFFFSLAIFSSQKKLKWQPSFPAAEMLLCSQFQSLLFTRQYKFSLYNKNNHLYSLAASNNTDSGASFGALEENMNHLSHRTKRRRPLSTEQSSTTTHRACSPTSAGVVVPRKKHLSCTSSEEYCCHISEV